jgi:hypothetical protein
VSSGGCTSWQGRKGDSIGFPRQDVRAFTLQLGKRQVEAPCPALLAFGSLDGQLKGALDNHSHPLNKLRRELPF